jgi:hypothetical protein
MTVLVRNGDGNPQKHISYICWADSEGGEPDANLIAAAPELYSALDAWLRAFKNSEQISTEDWNDACDHLIGKAESALAKARGSTDVLGGEG